MLISGFLPGVDNPVAMVGVAEKGYLTLELTAESEPGHSSTPPPETAIGILARGITRLEANPMPANPAVLLPQLKAVGKSSSFMNRLFYANLWLFGGFVRRMMEKKPQTNASMRTTTAVTMINGGVKDNILPREVTAKVNFRLLPQNPIEDVYKHTRHAIQDERIKVGMNKDLCWNASPVSPSSGRVFESLARTIRQFFGNVPVAPTTGLGATDARYYYQICENVYRFTPLQVQREDLKRVHGLNERIGVADLAKMVQFFTQLIKVWSSSLE